MREAPDVGLKLSQMIPHPGERCVIIGKTGSGKTTLARFLCNYRTHVVALDSKGTLRWDGFKVYATLRELQRAREPKLIYRPTIYEMRDAAILDAFFEWVFRRQHTTLYVDELAAIGDVGEYPLHFGACLTRGRELGVETWVSTQRPCDIPQIVLSESEHAYVFRLRLPQDQRRAADVVGVNPLLVAGLPHKEFFYAAAAGEPSGPYTLDLGAVTPKLAPGGR